MHRALNLEASHSILATYHATEMVFREENENAEAPISETARLLIEQAPWTILSAAFVLDGIQDFKQGKYKRAAIEISLGSGGLSYTMRTAFSYLFQKIVGACACR